MSDTQSKNESHKVPITYSGIHEHEVNYIIHNFNGLQFCFWLGSSTGSVIWYFNML